MGAKEYADEGAEDGWLQLHPKKGFEMPLSYAGGRWRLAPESFTIGDEDQIAFSNRSTSAKLYLRGVSARPGPPVSDGSRLPVRASQQIIVELGYRISFEPFDGLGTTRVAGRDGFDQVAPVKSLRPNPLGLYDMHGTVWEWPQDGYQASSYERRITKRTGRPHRRRLASHSRRLLYVTLALQRYAVRAPADKKAYGFNIGFRIVREIESFRTAAARRRFGFQTVLPFNRSLRLGGFFSPLSKRCDSCQDCRLVHFRWFTSAFLR